MEDLEIIRSVMEQHEILGDQFSFVSNTLSDKDALMRLEKAQSELEVNLRRPLDKRREYLIESLKTIELGLKHHYDFEEEKLPPLLGELLTEALIFEHKSLMEDMHSLIAMIREINLKGLSHVDEISQEAVMSESLAGLREKKMDHQKREEAVLLTLQYICEEKSGKSGTKT